MNRIITNWGRADRIRADLRRTILRELAAETVSASCARATAIDIGLVTVDDTVAAQGLLADPVGADSALAIRPFAASAAVIATDA